MRPITPLNIAGITPADLSGMKQPEFEIVDPNDLWVEDEEGAQREFVERSRQRALGIVAEFRWRNFSVPIVARAKERLLVLNGQTTAIACASHPEITAIPVLIVDAPDITDRAWAFVSHSRDHVPATHIQIWRGLVTAGDPEAVRIATMCERHGIKILRHPPPRGIYKPRETVAFRTIASLLRRYEQADVERILAAVANTDAAPISAVLLKAAECLLTDPEFASEVDPALITAAALSLPGMGEQEAKLFAATHNVPVWRALASVWFKASKKLPKRPAPKPATVPFESAYVAPPPLPKRDEAEEPDVVAAPVRRPSFAAAARRPSFEPAGFQHGDPPPGRSALDQRRAGV